VVGVERIDALRVAQHDLGGAKKIGPAHLSHSLGRQRQHVVEAGPFGQMVRSLGWRLFCLFQQRSSEEQHVMILGAACGQRAAV